MMFIESNKITPNIQENFSERILTLAEGDFSFTFALIRMIANQTKLELNKNKKYEIIATELEIEESAKKVELDINEFIQNQGMKNFITYQQISGINCRTPDAIDEGKIKGKFDRIILNFPTCNYGWKTTVFEDTLHQIKEKNLLQQNGQVEFMYWVEKEHKEECKYQLSRAKAKGFKLKNRTIADLEELARRGYGHVLDAQLKRQKNAITELALYAIYKLDERYKGKIKPREEEYTEISDEDNDLPKKGDGMPLREAVTLCQITKNNKLNMYGILQTRAEYKSKLFFQKSTVFKIAYELWIGEMSQHIQNKEYDKVEVILNILVESGQCSFDFLSKNHLFIHQVIEPLEKNYNTLLMENKIDEITHKNFPKYHQVFWYTKLKILTGMKIPHLSRYYNF